MSGRPTSPALPSALLDALHAPPPAPERAEQMHLFGRLVGSWDIDVATLDADGTWKHERGEWHFGWILEGRAIQDVWITPARGLRDPEGIRPEEYGTSIRLYDPADGGWRSVWIGPVLGKLRTFGVRETDDGVALIGSDDQGRPMHWVFSDMTDDAFEWRSQILEDAGETWSIVQTMKARRRPSPRMSTAEPER